MEHVVGIGKYAISASPEDVLKTFALSTCVGITVYSPARKVLGLIHIALPNSSACYDNRGMTRYADTGIKEMMNELSFKYGCCKPEELVAKIYGGIDSKAGDSFNIGEKNVRTSKSILKGMGIRIIAEDTGGRCSRTMTAYVGDGRVEITKYSFLK